MTSAYPLQWPDGWSRTPAASRRANSNFQTTFVRARSHLTDELRRLGATGVVISSWLPLRNDGQPRADAARMRIEDPGVAVYFARGERRLVIARDAFSNVHDNLRSIGLAVEHLRGLERHGGASMMERAFSGFLALPPPTAAARPWWDVLGVPPNAEEWLIDAAYKAAAKRAHPDVGGSAEQMAELNAARDEALKTKGAQ